MLTLERLEKDNIQAYDKIMAYFNSHGLTPSFPTPKHTITFTGK
jgi:hypothetical protein